LLLGVVTRFPNESHGVQGVSADRRGDCADGELPLQDSNLDYLIQSAGPRASETDNLTGRGVPTSIGALSV